MSIFIEFSVVFCRFCRAPSEKCEDALRDDSRRTSPLKVAFPAYEIGEPILVGKQSSEQRHELPLEIGQSIKVESPGVALTG